MTGGSTGAAGRACMVERIGVERTGSRRRAARGAILRWMPLALGVCATPAIAQDTIVVTGDREAEARSKVFATRLTERDPSTPLALYEKGVYCPFVEGLSDGFNRQIAARMKAVAAAAGLEPAGAGCATTVLVLMDDNREALLAAFRRLQPAYFQKITGEEIDFQGRREPVMAWKILARVDQDDNPVQTDTNGIQIVVAQQSISRLQAASRPVIVMTVVLIERRAVTGLTTQQIADYAFMRSVSDEDPKTLGLSDKGRTILAVIDAEEGEPTPLSLTAWDFAYAKARYAVNPWNNAPSQIAQIRAAMARAAADLPQD